MKKKIGILFLCFLVFPWISVLAEEIEIGSNPADFGDISDMVADEEFWKETTGDISIHNNTDIATSFDKSLRGSIVLLKDHRNNLNYVYYDNKNVYIQKLDSSDKKSTLLTIPKKYPVFGNITVDSNGNYYIAWGQDDDSSFDTESGVVSFAVSKYDNNGTFIKSYEKNNSKAVGGTAEIFNTSACNMAINDAGILAYNYGHKMKNGHQSNVAGYIDIATMTEPSKYKAYPYTSHSMYTDVISYGTDGFLFAAQGDAYQRGYNLTAITKASDGMYLNYSYVPFHFREGLGSPFGYNYTFANYGGILELKDSLVLVAASEKTLSMDPAPSNYNEPRNLFIQIIKKEMYKAEISHGMKEETFITKGKRTTTGTKHTTNGNEEYFLTEDTTDYGVQWLTDYQKDIGAGSVKVTSVDNDGIFIMWNEKRLGYSGIRDTYYMVLNNDGSIRYNKTKIEVGSVPGYEQPIYKDGYIYFINSDATNEVSIYKIKLYEKKLKTKIVVPTSEKILNTLDSFKIEAYISTGSTLVFESSDTNIAEVSSDGVVTPKKNGTVTITLSAKDKPKVEKETMSITIDIHATDLTLSQTSVKMNYDTLKEETIRIRPTITPSEVKKEISWSSTNENIAKIKTVYSSGEAVVVATGKGNCEIVASITNVFPDGSKKIITKKVNVNVSVRVKSFQIQESRLEMAQKESYTLTTNISPANADNQKIKWTSSNPAVAIVLENGVIKALSDGSTTIEGVSEDNSSLKDVVYVTVRGISSDLYRYSINEDGTAKITKYLGNSSVVNIPDTIDGHKVTGIDGYIFGESSKVNNTVTSVMMPSTVTRIEGSAFAYMSKMDKISIPKSVTVIGSNITRGSSIKTIEVEKENQKYYSIDGVLYSNNGYDIYLQEYPCGKENTTYVVENQVTYIDAWAFNLNHHLKELYVSSTVKTIGFYGIKEMSNLEKLFIANEEIYYVDSYSTAISDNPKIKIYAKSNSTSQSYATKYNIPFIAQEVKIQSVTLNPSKIILTKRNERKKLSDLFQFYPAYATNTNMEYVSSNTDIVTVSNGYVQAVSGGKAKITAKTLDGSNITKTIEVEVNILCTSVYIPQSTFTLYKDESRSFTTIVYPTYASNKKISYRIENENIASVDANGVLKGKKNGTTKLIIKTLDGSNITKEIPVNVTGFQNFSVEYQSQVQNKGWILKVSDGDSSGTTGSGLRMEAFKANLAFQEYSGNIEYRSHIQNIGWESAWKKNGEMSGTTGKGLRLEAIQMRLSGAISNYYDLYYRVHVQNFGWLSWAKNGSSAGSAGYGYRIEAIQIKLVKKGGSAPGSIVTPFKEKILAPSVSYKTQVQNVGWMVEVKDGASSGTSGKGLRLETMQARITNSPYAGGIEYRSHVQNIGWESAWKENGVSSGTTGKGLRLEAMQIRLTGDLAKNYDVYYRVHVQNLGWMGWAKNGSSAGSAGYGYRIEAIQIKLVKKGDAAPGSTTNAFKQKK